MELYPYVIRKELTQIFEQVRNAVEENKSGFTMSPAINIIYKVAGRHIKSELNYDLIAKSFNHAFFLLNFLKNFIFLDVVLDHGFVCDSDILDIGCGSAPASIATHKLFLERGLKQRRFTLIDKSQRQINMAKMLCKTMGIDVKSYSIDPFNFQDGPYNDTAFLSYFICEQSKDFIDKLYQQQDQFKHGFVVIDYDYVVDHIVNTFSPKRGHSIQAIGISATLPKELANCLRRDEVTIYGCFYS